MMKASSINTENLICIASIGKPRGLRGEFFLNSYCNPKENILEYSNFYIQNNSIPNFQIEYIKRLNTKFCAKVEDINDINEIKKFTNFKIYLNKEDLPKLDKNEAYWFELINMEVIDISSGDFLGNVSSLNNFGAQDCLEINPTKLSVDNKKRLIPFIKDVFIQKIDKDQNIIHVNWDKTF